MKAITAIIKRVFEPRADTRPEHRPRVVLLNIILLSMAVAILLSAALADESNRRVLLVGLGSCLIGAYALNQRGHHRPAVIIVLVLASVQPMVLAITQPTVVNTPGLALERFVWLAVIIALSSVFLSRWVPLVLAGVQTLGIVAVGWLSSNVEMTAIGRPILFLWGVAVVVYGAAALRVRQATALRASENRFRSLFSATIEATALCDNGTIIAVNPAFESLFQIASDHAVGRPLGDFVDLDGAGVGDPMDDDTQRETTGRPAHGAAFVAALIVRHGHQYQERSADVISIRDITAQKRAQRALIQAKESAEAASRTLQDFLANMNHELRTPMNAVVGMTELLLRTELDPQQRDLASTALHGGTLMAEIIDDILDMVAISSDQLVLDERPFDLYACVESALVAAADRAPADAVELACHIAPSTPQHVVGDARRVGELLARLLSNAIKFTTAGEVVVSLRPARASSPHDGPAATVDLQLSVTDTGIGISAESRRRLFEPFWQSDTSRTRRYGGLGVGLTICKHLVERMNGRISVDSEIDRGSTFSVIVTLQVSDRPRSPHLCGDQPALMGKRVLIVTSDATVADIVQTWTTWWHMSVERAASPQQALSRMQAAPRCDVIALDAQCAGPGRDTLAREPRAIRLIRPITLLALHRAITDAIPSRAEASAPPQALPAAALARRPIEILLVEDNRINQKVTSRLLAQLGYSADIAVNGVEAIQAVRDKHYHVVLMDWHMPEMDGLEATRRIRSDIARQRQPRIIAVTADVSRNARSRCIEAGMDAYLAKPIQLRDLALALEADSQATGR